ncbi:MAG: fibronectin type III-like domain-contianing protein, partial [Clostridia bacterium]|nr:fibronectin type III-like domain-contianing protein [Clostridia bacterium]
AAADVLVGRIAPCGRLPDTIARTLDDYPSTAHFGAQEYNCYCEDVYVGYRYFETFAPEKVRYPFGYGLSYTTFATETLSVEDAGGQIRLQVAVTNTGAVAGRQVVQVYFGAPQGKLGRPAKELAAFGKTRLLAPGESETLSLAFDIDRMAAYDDAGVTGHPYAFVLEAGDYVIFAGDNVRDAKPVFTYPVAETVVTEQLEQALAPIRPFERMRPVAREGGFAVEYEPVPLRQYDVKDRIVARRPADLPQTGDRGLRLVDVKEGRCSMDEFIAELADSDLTAIARGEGMNSPKVAGSGSAFGGVTERLQLFGIPAVSTSDGPSGLRMQTVEEQATLMPCGNLLAATFDEALNEELFTWEGVEMKAYAVDALLGPGINIHRNPLNGRNFEYFSEDPFLTGVMAAAQCRGMAKSGVTGTIKHFCANSQEINRSHGDSVVSERALREIYLRPFEMAIKEGGALAVMTAYNSVNGVHTSSNYDLNTTILREEWGFDGVVMTDWWTYFNEEGGPDDGRLRHVMVRAQNDVCMVVVNGSAGDDSQDDILAALADGRITRGELQRNAANVCRYAMRVDAMARYAESDYRPRLRKQDGALLFVSEDENVRYVDFEAAEDGLAELALTAIVEGDELAQIPFYVAIFGTATTRFQLHGTGGKPVVFATEGAIRKGQNRFTVCGRPKGVRIVKVEVREI